jgi:hypothetical protein
VTLEQVNAQRVYSIGDQLNENDALFAPAHYASLMRRKAGGKWTSWQSATLHRSGRYRRTELGDLTH